MTNEQAKRRRAERDQKKKDKAIMVKASDMERTADLSKEGLLKRYLPWVRLGNAIAREILYDYRAALRKGEDSYIAYLERDIADGWFSVYTMGRYDPEAIISTMRKRYYKKGR